MSEWHCTVDGKQYGPVDEEGLRAWIVQGRLKPTDLVWKEGMAEWVQAGSAAELRDTFAASTTGAIAGGPPAVPTGSYAGSRIGGGGYLRPHRGGGILALGILGLVVCCICGIIAWSMGNTDLREMDAGRMDPSGRGITQAGRICGMISTILAIIGGVLWLLVAAVASA